MITLKIDVSRKMLIDLISDTRSAKAERLILANCPAGHRFKEVVWPVKPCAFEPIEVELVYVDLRGGARPTAGRPRMPKQEKKERLDVWVPAADVAYLKQKWGEDYKKQIAWLIRNAVLKSELFTPDRD